MQTTTRVIGLLVACCSLLCVGTTGVLYGGPIRYLVTQIGETWRGTAINNLGQVAGYGIFDGKMRAFLYADGSVTILGTLGGGNSSGWGINDSGQVAGWADVVGGNGHAFRYSDGQMQDLGTLGGTMSQAGAINNSGHVVGSAYTGDGASPAFIYHDDQMFELGTLAGGEGFANGLGVNDSGQVAGVSQLAPGSGVTHAFLYSGGMMTDLTPRGGQSSAGGSTNSGR